MSLKKTSLSKWLLLFISLTFFCAVIFFEKDNLEIAYEYIFRKKASVDDRLKQYLPIVTTNLQPLFLKNEISFPPSNVTLVFFKETNELSMFAQNSSKKWKLIKTYPVTAASGKWGPKLKEGDQQVPEGIYKIDFLNANSKFHLSLKLNYPNAFDRKKAETDNRAHLGGDIMIHGGRSSIGCIAIGDTAIEEVFTLAGISNYKNWDIVIAPFDLRLKNRFPDKNIPNWISELDQLLLEKLQQLP